MKMRMVIFTCMAAFLCVTNTTGATNIVALLPESGEFVKVLDGIRGELGDSYHVDVIDMLRPFNIGDIAKQCKMSDAKALLLMDSKAVNTAMELQKQDSLFKAIPKFVSMTLIADVTAQGLSNVCGIKFEVPIYTLVTNFRIISKKDFSSVGVFYRKSFSRSIQESQNLLAKEKINLNSLCLDCDNSQKTSQETALAMMSGFFDKTARDGSVDVFLVLADNLVLNNKTLVDFWLEKVKRGKIPVIAPLDLLTSPKMGLAIFSVYPDLPQLGVQAANQITDYFENRNVPATIGFEPIISIKSTLNSVVAQETGWKLKQEKLGRITTIIK